MPKLLLPKCGVLCRTVGRGGESTSAGGCKFECALPIGGEHAGVLSLPSGSAASDECNSTAQYNQHIGAGGIFIHVMACHRCVRLKIKVQMIVLSSVDLHVASSPICSDGTSL